MKEQESYEEARIKKIYLKILEGKLLFIIGIPLLAILITVFVFHFYRVDGSSMEHTFQDRNLLMVEKTGKSFSKLFHKTYVPKRYEIIVFKQPSYDPSLEIVKRVIGLPGERVVVKDDKVTVYNNQHPEGFMPDDNLPPQTQVVKDVYDHDNVDVRLKPGEVFVMGDNRPGSDDSRYFGPVKTDNIIGKVTLRILPLNEFWIL